MSRVDAPVYLIPLPLVAAVAWVSLRSSDDRRFLARMAGAVLLGAAPVSVLGLIDVERRAGHYYDDLHTDVHRLQVGLAGSALFGVAVLIVWWVGGRYLRPLLARLSAHRGAIGSVAGVLVMLVVFGAWLVRPRIHEAERGPRRAGWISAARGRPASRPHPHLRREVGPVAELVPRSRHDRARRPRRWVSRGPLGPPARRRYDAHADSDRRRIRAVPLATIDHPRPDLGDAAFRAGRVAAHRAPPPLAIVVIAEAAARRASAAEPVLLAVGALGLMLPPALITKPVRNFVPGPGDSNVNLAGVQKICTTTGPDAAILTAYDDPSTLELVGAIRTWCRVPVAYMTRPFTAQEISHLAYLWRLDSRDLWVIGSSSASVTASAPTVSPELIAATVLPRELEMTIDRAPNRYSVVSAAVYGGPVP